MNSELLTIHEYTGRGFLPLVDFGQWRVAVLRFDNGLLVQNIKDMQRHNETDEVFVLLEGRCLLFIGEGDMAIENIHAVNMEPLKLYNVKRSTWHNHTLTEDASVLIIENRDTSPNNSPKISLSVEQQQQLVRMTSMCWSE
jgi:hypothetical protein